MADQALWVKTRVPWDGKYTHAHSKMAENRCCTIMRRTLSDSSRRRRPEPATTFSQTLSEDRNFIQQRFTTKSRCCSFQKKNNRRWPKNNFFEISKTLLKFFNVPRITCILQIDAAKYCMLPRDPLCHQLLVTSFVYLFLSYQLFVGSILYLLNCSNLY